MPKPTKQKAPKGSRVSTQSDVTITDPRFSNIHTDPRYRLPSKKHTHVKLDKRFAQMLRDDDFSKKATVDRYGRKLPKGAGKKELQRFYRVDEDEDGEGVNGGDTERLDDDDDDVREELKRVERSYDPAREGGFSSSSEESSSDEEDGNAQEEDEEGIISFPDTQVGQQAEVPMGEISSRLAVVNLDWDNIRAADLMVVFASFTPSNGRVLKVSVYPSEFGKERMEREETEGPPPEIFAQSKQGHGVADLDRQDYGDANSGDGQTDEDGEDEDENIKKDILAEDKGEEFDSAALRHYQLERLRYYYAVMTCSSPTIAKALYEATDGTEYLTTANFFDLRFIPDDVSFEDDKPRDECESIPDGYRPNEFVTDALQHSKVRLTWDADDGVRKEAQKRAFTGSRAELDENDLRAYLGSDSSEDEEPTPAEGTEEGKQLDAKLSKKEAERQRMRSLLGLSDNAASIKPRKEPGAPMGDMQITFAPGLSSETKKTSVFENEPEQEETTVERYVRKEKERKARRKQKAKSGGIPEGGEIDGVKVAAEELDAVNELQDKSGDLGFDDPFFTAPEDDKAAASALRKEERRKKREQRAADEAATATKRAELELLMVDDERADVAHFDMNEIQRAEKRAKKKGKKAKKGKESELQAEQEGFQMDVQDPRFSRLFESHEFAIDPTNPRFKGTEGMKALLEEGRRKRRRDDTGGDYKGINDPAGEQKVKRSKGIPGEGGIADGGEDLEKLVQRVKGKTKRKPI
ncbi:MAG: hypothetical protein M1812_000785 [Candelaria pacifica]|nr:MAG: hypothetical protein M1812_000785 [Candelaria pacifica]